MVGVPAANRECPVSFPLPGGTTTCGLLLDLPRVQRVHWWVSLGEDFANHGEGGIVQVEVRACARCGKDKR